MALDKAGFHVSCAAIFRLGIMRIGPYTLPNNLILAPMAGVTDLPFRRLCARFGAGLTVSEMVISQAHLQTSPKMLRKIEYAADTGIHSVQILGTEPKQMADAARLNQDRGAQIIDINMGCPAKKVCSVMAGSALLRDEARVESILVAVVKAVQVPVTLKIRTGWEPAQRNAVRIANIAQSAGIQALTIHGRTRACRFNGQAEYDTIRDVKHSVAIPVIANGDIDSADKVRAVLAHTGADAVMIGRAAQGRPWIFAELCQALPVESPAVAPPTLTEIQTTIRQHLDALYHFYGNDAGVKIARKHLGWYFRQLGGIPPDQARQINQAEHPAQQLARVNASFHNLNSRVA